MGVTSAETANTGQSANGSLTADRSTTGSGSASEATGSKSGASTSKSASDSAGSGLANLSKDPIARLGQWVSDNTLAAIAILLALVALVLAWALRSSKPQRPGVSGATPTVSAPAAAFEKQLKEIDLSLDEPSGAPSAVNASQIKPDAKA